jgi:hypothetical protein
MLIIGSKNGKENSENSGFDLIKFINKNILNKKIVLTENHIIPINFGSAATLTNTNNGLKSSTVSIPEYITNSNYSLNNFSITWSSSSTNAATFTIFDINGTSLATQTISDLSTTSYCNFSNYSSTTIKGFYVTISSITGNLINVSGTVTLNKI